MFDYLRLWWKHRLLRALTSRRQVFGPQAQYQCLGQAAWVVAWLTDRCPRNAYAPWCQPSLPRSSRLAQMDSMSLRMQLPSFVRAGAVPSLIELSCVFSSTHAIDLLDPLPSPVWSLPDSDHWHGIPVGSSSSSSSHISKLPIAKTLRNLPSGRLGYVI